MVSISAQGNVVCDGRGYSGLGTDPVPLAQTEGFYCPWYLGWILLLKTVLYIDAFRVKPRGDGVLQNTKITGELP